MVRSLLTREEKSQYFIKFNVDGFCGRLPEPDERLRHGKAERWMSANDIRELENLDRIPQRKAAICT